MDSAPAHRFLLRAAGATHVGRRRPHNEDHVLVRDDLALFLVADGAGGHLAGEVASALAARSIANYVGATVRATWAKPEVDSFGIPAGARRLAAAVLKANRDVIEISRSSNRHRGMGTTVVAAQVSSRSGLLHVAHVGDSRCYRLRGGHLELLTQDHSLVNEVLEQRPELEDAVLARLPRNVVTRALGMDEKLRVSIRSHGLAPGDRYLLCSDGLSNPVDGESLGAVLAEGAPPERAVARLVELANDRGGPDNIGVVVLDCERGATGEGEPERVSTFPVAPWTDDETDTAPELLILGIEELTLPGGTGVAVVPASRATGDLLQALDELVGIKPRG